MVLPGPEAQQLATYMGWLMHRTQGGIVAGVLFVLPSFFILTALSWIYLVHGDVPLVAGLFYGIKPAVTVIVLKAAHRIGSSALRSKGLWAMAIASFVAGFAFGVPFPAIVLVAGVIGLVGGHMVPDQFKTQSHRREEDPSRARALIDDDTPLPEHALNTRIKLIRVALVGVFLWVLPMGMLTVTFGRHHDLTQMGWFFTKAALLTLGGAYAVLPYVYQGAVEVYGWLTPIQMMDGLALGETTPGPLVMVATFVGFVGGYVKAVLGPDSLFLSGALAAAAVTWFTFLPSFVLILMGGPLIETTHNDLKFTRPLLAITAAVVGGHSQSGVLLRLSPLLAGRIRGIVSGGAALIALGAAGALLWLKAEVIPVIAGCALVGLLVQTLCCPAEIRMFQ